MSRPRESILSLFDPLHDGAISDDGEASDDYDSDKENSAPPAADMTMGTFFKSFKPTATSQPVVLRKRLVDVGDVTVDESYLASVSEDDEDEDEFGDENTFLKLDLVEQTPKSTIVHGTLRPSPRTPLMELQPEHEATPVAAKRMLKRQLFPLQKSLAVAPTKPDGPLSSLVDSINAQGVSFSDSKLPKSPVPAITISSPDATPTTAEFPHSSTILPDDHLEPPTPRPPKAPASLTDRLSLDLQASFQLHFDSPEASFDLLNDKISFFGHTSRDFGSTSGDEEELDLYTRDSGSDGEKTPPARPVRSDIPECKLSVESKTVLLSTEHHSSPSTTRPVSALSIDLPEEPKGPSPVNEPLVEQRQPAAFFDEPQTDEEEVPVLIGCKDPLTTPAPKSNQFSVPPPVQALRIVKRSKPVLSTAAERRMSSRPVQRADEKEKPVAKRPSRPSTSANEPHTALKPSAQSKPSVHVAVTSNGPRRMPVTMVEPSDSSTSKVVAPTKTLPGGGPRRFVTAEVNAQMRTQKVTLESVRDAINAIGIGHGKTASMARPTRQVSSAVPVKESGRSTSTLPRPVSSTSRLPAPTFGLNKAGRGAKPASGITRRV